MCFQNIGSNISGWFWEDIPVPNFQGISRSQKIAAAETGDQPRWPRVQEHWAAFPTFHDPSHRIHGTGILTYMKTIKINHSCRQICHKYTSVPWILYGLESKYKFMRKKYVSDIFTLQTFPMSSWIQLHGSITDPNRCLVPAEEMFSSHAATSTDMLWEPTSTQQIQKKKDPFLGHLLSP